MFNILAGAWRQRYVIVLPILLLPLVGLLIGIISPKHYSSHTSMLIQETAKMNPFLEDMAISFMLKERMGTLKTLLHSRHILGAVAKERGLINLQTSAKKHDEVIAKLSNSLSVKMAGMDLIRIDYRSNNPEGMKEMLEAVSKQFVEQLLAPERSSMKDSSYFLSEHIKKRQLALDKAEIALANFKNLHANDLPELHPGNIDRLAKMKQRLSERKSEMAGATRRLGGLDQQLSKTNPVLGRIEEQIIRIRGELALSRARYTDKHSSIQGALRNLRRLEEERQNILSHTQQTIDVNKLWSIVSSAPINNDKNIQPLLVSQLENLQLTRSKVDGLGEEIKSLEQMISDLEKQTSGYGRNSSEFSKLERDLKIKRDLYDDLLLRNEKARITMSLGIFEQDKRVKVIDRPFTPSAPSNLPLYLFFVAGLFAGMFLGCGLAIIFEISDTTLRRRDQLEALTGVPMLSRIPPLRTDFNY
jgi:polysaccharide chain length determinant protein (PEP-CTERM system associated)